MKLTKKEVDHVAKLARLALTEEEKEQLAGQLNDILAYVDKLNQLDTEGVEPLAHVFPAVNVFREDEVRPSLPIEEVLRNAPDKEGRFFKVPSVLES